MEVPNATLITNIETRRKESWMGRFLPWKHNHQEALMNARQSLVVMLKQRQEERDAELATQLELAARQAAAWAQLSQQPEPILPTHPILQKPPTVADELVQSLKTSSNRADFIAALQKCADLGDSETAKRIMRRLKGPADEEILLLLTKSYLNSNNLLEALGLVERHVAKGTIPLGVMQLVFTAVPNTQSLYHPVSSLFIAVMQQSLTKAPWIRQHSFFTDACFKYLWICRTTILQTYVSYVRDGFWNKDYDKEMIEKQVHDAFAHLDVMPKDALSVAVTTSRVATYALYLADQLQLHKTPAQKSCSALLHKSLKRKLNGNFTFEYAVAMNELRDASLLESYQSHFTAKLKALNPHDCERDLRIVMICCGLHFQLIQKLGLDWQQSLDNAVAVLNKAQTYLKQPGGGVYLSLLVLLPDLNPDNRVLVLNHVFSQSIPFSTADYADVYDQVLATLPLAQQQSLAVALRSRGLHVFNKELFKTWLENDHEQAMAFLSGRCGRLDIWEMALSYPNPELAQKLLSSPNFPIKTARKETWELASRCVVNLEQLDMFCHLIDAAGADHEVLINAATLGNILDVVIKQAVLPKKQDTARLVSWLTSSKSWSVDGAESREESLMSILGSNQ